MEFASSSTGINSIVFYKCFSHRWKVQECQPSVGYMAQEQQAWQKLAKGLYIFIHIYDCDFNPHSDFCNAPADLNTSKRPGTSDKIAIHFAIFNHLYLLILLYCDTSPLYLFKGVILSSINLEQSKA